MFGLRKLIFGGGGSDLPPALAEAVATWEAMPEPDLADLHFHARYIVLDVKTSGPQVDSDRLLSVAALVIDQAGRVVPEAAVVIDLVDDAGEWLPAVDARLIAFLQFIGKAPLVTYHGVFVIGFLQKVLRERLGLDFQPRQIDLAWLLPSLFSEKAHSPLPLDEWLQHFNVEFVGRRSLMENTLQLARLFQRVLVKAMARQIDTAEQLLQESDACSFLRRNR